MVIYHGTNIPKKNILVMDMFHKDANCQEGPGVYFALDKDVAKTYGERVYVAEVDLEDFVDSRADLCDIGTDYQITTLLRYINEMDSNFWEFFTDYGIEVEYQHDITKVGYAKVVSLIRDEQVRNILVELVQNSSMEVVQSAWMEVYKKKGTYNKELGFLAVMDTKVKIKSL